MCGDATGVNNISKLSSQDLYNISGLEGKTVSLTGFFSYNFEDIALYPNMFNPNEKGIWLAFDKASLKNDSILVRFNGKRVMIIGKLNFSSKGHLNSYFCTLENITCMKEL